MFVTLAIMSCVTSRMITHWDNAYFKDRSKFWLTKYYIYSLIRENGSALFDRFSHSVWSRDTPAKLLRFKFKVLTWNIFSLCKEVNYPRKCDESRPITLVWDTWSVIKRGGKHIFFDVRTFRIKLNYSRDANVWHCGLWTTSTTGTSSMFGIKGKSFPVS